MPRSLPLPYNESPFAEVSERGYAAIRGPGNTSKNDIRLPRRRRWPRVHGGGRYKTLTGG
jgi:hypothetical protein